MQVLYERCCGVDVHKKTVVACVLITSPDGQVHKQVRYRKTRVPERAQAINRLHKVRETANSKVSSVGSLVMG
jgi:transposase